ncbi:MAG TPA: DUF4157 domain-containing protein [Telluria sp.]|nr:DUF4157 domain-containing protein [Telluria sp.]
MRVTVPVQQDNAPATESHQRTAAPETPVADERAAAVAQRQLSRDINTSPRTAQLKQLQDAANAPKSSADGLPAPLRTGIEQLSGLSMADVQVHRNSPKPAQLQAHAYAQGNQIHLAPGQERHLPHEAWHVVQQKRGRVQATTQLKPDVNINDTPALEREADTMGALAASTPAAHAEPRPLAKSAAAGAVVQPVWDMTAVDADTTEQIQRLAALREKYILAAFKKYAATDHGAAGRLDALLDQILADGGANDAVKELLLQTYDDHAPHTAAAIMTTIESAPAVRMAPGNTQLIGTVLRDRMAAWRARLGQRQGKSSDAARKRGKLHRQTGAQSLLMLTHTAPADDTAGNEHRQGKDLRPTATTHFDYFRTGENRQSQFFKHQNRKQFVFVDPVYNFYKELDDAAQFKNMAAITPGISHAEFDRGRYQHSGYGAEVNSYAKEKLLTQGGKAFKGDTTPAIDAQPKRYMDTTHQALVSGYLDAASDPQTDFAKSHASTVLDHCRQIVAQLAALHPANFRIVVAGQHSEFFTYPCPIIEPKGPALTTATIKPHMDFLMNAFNRGSKVKMYQRNSFGFLYPTIADLQRSIRLWPGQLDPDYYVAKMTQALALYDTWLGLGRPGGGPPDAVAPSAAITPGHAQHETLFSTLARAMSHVRGVVKKGGFQPGPTLDYVQQRLIGNLTKAQMLLKMQRSSNFHGMDKGDLFLEVTQVIENLNEFGLQLVELQQWAPTSMEFGAAVHAAYGAAIAQHGYHLNGAALTHSGMQAGMIAMMLRKQSRFDLGPAYFEFPGSALNDKIAKDARQGRTGHYDPAYNFTHHDEVGHHAVAPFKDSDHQCIIVDITNVKPSEVGGVLARHQQNTPSIFLYASLSKHFQFGMDRFTLGLVMELNKVAQPSALGSYNVPVELIRYYIQMQHAHNLGLAKELQ